MESFILVFLSLIVFIFHFCYFFCFYFYKITLRWSIGWEAALSLPLLCYVSAGPWAQRYWRTGTGRKAGHSRNLPWNNVFLTFQRGVRVEKEKRLLKSNINPTIPNSSRSNRSPCKRSYLYWGGSGSETYHNPLPKWCNDWETVL